MELYTIGINFIIQLFGLGLTNKLKYRKSTETKRKLSYLESIIRKVIWHLWLTWWQLWRIFPIPFSHVCQRKRKGSRKGGSPFFLCHFSLFALCLCDLVVFLVLLIYLSMTDQQTLFVFCWNKALKFVLSFVARWILIKYSIFSMGYKLFTLVEYIVTKYK